MKLKLIAVSHPIRENVMWISYVDVKHVAADKNKVRTSKLYNIFLFCLFVLRSFPKV